MKLDLYNKIKTVPKEAQKEIKGGRISGFTDINPMWRIKTLTENFGMAGFGWYTQITDQWLEANGNEVKAFVTINLYVKGDEDWSMPIEGIGGSSFATHQSGGVYVSDECYKMAYTDALSVACKALGMGADVYWSEGSKYTSNEPAAAYTKPANNVKCVQCKKNIIDTELGGKKYTAAEIVKRSKDKYKVALHFECANDFENAHPTV